MHYRPILVFVFFLILVPKIYAQNSDEYELVSIQFHGNNTLSESDLSNIITSRETPNWFYKFLNTIWDNIGRPPSYFDSTKIPGDIKSLENYYRDNGFFEVNINASYSLDEKNKEATIVFAIKEGPRFRISDFRIRGIRDLPEEFKEMINSGITIDSNDIYSKDAIERNRRTILTFLLDHGFMLASQNPPQILIDTTNKTIDARLRFIPGLRYRINQVRVNKSGLGKDNVKDTLLKRLVGILPGDFYSLDNINRGQVRLYRTNLFSSVLVNSVVSDTSDSRVPLAINADIERLHELSPEIILNNQASAFNLGLGLSYTQKNFFGDARNFTISTSFAVQDFFNIDYSRIPDFLALTDTSILGYLDARVSFDQPYLFGKLIRTKLDIYSTLNKQREYKSVSIGSKISMDFELPKFVYFTAFQLYYSLDRSKYNFNSDYIKSLLESSNSQMTVSQGFIDSLTNNLGSAGKREFTTSLIGLDLSANKTNDILFPTKGYTLNITAEEANFIPYVLDKFFKTNFKTNIRFYRMVIQGTLFPKIYKSDLSAFGLKLRVGYVQAYKGSSNDIPFNSRFAAGGSNSVRGWRARELVPPSTINVYELTVQNFLDRYLNKLPVGGTFLLEGSIETRNRLVGPLGSALFLDFGNTWNGYQQFRFNDVAVAAGFGLRFYSSFAPIRLDFGFKAYDPLDRKTLFEKFKHSTILSNIQFQLGIGEAF